MRREAPVKHQAPGSVSEEQLLQLHYAVAACAGYVTAACVGYVIPACAGYVIAACAGYVIAVCAGYAIPACAGCDLRDLSNHHGRGVR